MRVALLFGGRSVEHEVSVVSARGVAAAIVEAGLTCVPIGVTQEGRWLVPEVSQALLASAAAVVRPPEHDDGSRIWVDPGAARLACHTPGRAPSELAIDVVFPLLHGWGGEDGRLQGALDLAGLPYVGAGVLGSAVAMDKAIAKRLFESAGLPVTPSVVLEQSRAGTDLPEARRRIETSLGFPVFVKPANGGSSVGVSRVERPAGLDEALTEAWSCDAKAVVEVAVSAREIECAVLGNDDPQASVLGEIVPAGAFYDYASKYLDDRSQLIIPAPLDAAATSRIRALALAAFQALDLCGLARVDFLVDRHDGRVFLNEVNTLPGFTPISMFPKLWHASGLPYPRLIERLVGLAVERSRALGRRRTDWRRPEPA